MEPTTSIVLDLLKAKSNRLNQVFQEFQKEIKCAVEQMMDKPMNDKRKAIYRHRISTLCNNYSSTINRLEIEYLTKCEQSIQTTNKVNKVSNSTDHVLVSPQPPSPTTNNSPLYLKPNDIPSQSEDENDHDPSGNISNASSSHSKETHECTQCDAICQSEDDLQKHIQSDHCWITSTSKAHHCDECDKSFNSPRLLYSHLRDAHDIVLLDCNQCTEKFKHRVHLKKHQNIAHARTIRTPRKRRSTKKDENISNNSHDEDDSSTSSDIKRPFKCVECDLSYTQESSLKRHRKKIHSASKQTKCDVCGQQCSNAFELKQHKSKRHDMTVSLYPCSSCRSVFIKKKLLYKHIRTAHNGYPFECGECKQKFKYYLNLKEHEKNKHNKNSKKNKKKKDTTRYAVECNDCEATFADKQQLNRHRNMVHAVINPNPLECDVCGKVFATKYNVVLHKTVHTDERPFSCEYCDKTFKIQNYLTTHIKKAHKKNPWKCDQCDETFRVFYALKKHVKDAHESTDNNESEDAVDSAKDVDPISSQSGDGTSADLLCSICKKEFDECNDLMVCSDCKATCHYTCMSSMEGNEESNNTEWKCGSCDAKEDEVSCSK
eukprot:107654_1